MMIDRPIEQNLQKKEYDEPCDAIGGSWQLLSGPKVQKPREIVEKRLGGCQNTDRR
jgi:hypothetical protein